MKLSDLKYDCRYFRGDIPCSPNKLRGKICGSCDEYSPISKRILIIKLGALGDVIRTTPLVKRFRNEFPSCHITWLTHSPEILPSSDIDDLLAFNFQSLSRLAHIHFDIAINLDKELEACALLTNISANKKYGFVLVDGHISATNKASEHKLMTGLFDNCSKENTKSYLEEIFEICEMDFRGEEYLLEVSQELSTKWTLIKTLAKEKKIIGLNTGCGKRWPTRLWPETYWTQLIEVLNENKYFPILLGGKDEDIQNLSFSKKTGAYYPGTYELPETIAIANQCDLIVSAVSLMMHITIALKKPLILFNNIFNRNEFFLYGRGEIIEPTSGCDDFYGGKCSRTISCMQDISVEKVFDSIVIHSKINS